MAICSLAVVLELHLFDLSRKIFFIQYKVSYLLYMCLFRLDWKLKSQNSQ